MRIRNAFDEFFRLCTNLRACLYGGGGPQIGEVTCGGSPYLSCKRGQINMRDYMDKRVTSLTWGSGGSRPSDKEGVVGGQVIQSLR